MFDCRRWPCLIAVRHMRPAPSSKIQCDSHLTKQPAYNIYTRAVVVTTALLPALFYPPTAFTAGSD